MCAMAGASVAFAGLFFVAIMTVVIVLVLMAVNRNTTASADAAADLAEAEAFIEHLRELAWQHRDIAPELSTIITDEISKRHRGLT